MTADAVTQANLETGEYEMIVDFAKYFDPETHWGERSTPGNWMHANTVRISEVEEDRQFVVTMKYLSAVICFDYDTLEMLWVMSSEIPSDWTFDKSTSAFYNPHAGQILPSGNMLVFDNGNGRPISDGGLFT